MGQRYYFNEVSSAEEIRDSNEVSMDREIYYVDTGLNKRYFLDEISLKNFVAEFAESLKMKESSSIFIKKTRIGIQRGDTVRVVGEGSEHFTIEDIFTAQDGGIIVVLDNGCIEDLKKVSLAKG